MQVSGYGILAWISSSQVSKCEYAAYSIMHESYSNPMSRATAISSGWLIRYSCLECSIYIYHT